MMEMDAIQEPYSLKPMRTGKHETKLLHRPVLPFSADEYNLVLRPLDVSTSSNIFFKMSLESVNSSKKQ